jgi:hypothetical protein
MRRGLKPSLLVKLKELEQVNDARRCEYSDDDQV